MRIPNKDLKSLSRCVGVLLAFYCTMQHNWTQPIDVKYQIDLHYGFLQKLEHNSNTQERKFVEEIVNLFK